MGNPDQSGNQSPPATADETQSGTKPAEHPPARRRDPRFRISLLEKLPALEFTSWSAQGEFEADEEWTGIDSHRSDAVLSPLEPLAPAQRGE